MKQIRIQVKNVYWSMAIQGQHRETREEREEKLIKKKVNTNTGRERVLVNGNTRSAQETRGE